MKKFIIAALAATVAATPVLASPYQGHSDRGRIEQSHRGTTTTRVVVKQVDRRPQANHRWQRGQRFESRYARNYRILSNPHAYRLHDAPRGYRWVQSGNDAVLVGITSGIIASVVANMIR